MILAAVAAFDEHGYDAATMGTIAERLGVSKSALYHHVGGKEELLTLALETAFDALDAGLTATEQSQESLEVRLEQFVSRMIDILVERQPFVRLLLRLRGNSPAELRALERRRHFDTRMAALVRQAQAGGMIRDDVDPVVLARLLYGALNSTVEWFRPDGRISRDELKATVLTVILRGITPAPVPVAAEG